MHICYKKTALVLVMLLLASFSFIGCGKSEKQTEETNSVVETDNQVWIYDENSNLGKDSKVAFSETGYYYQVNTILYFYDADTSISVPVCSKADCGHNSSDCDAYVYDNADYDTYSLSGISVKCLGNMIWYNDGHLYIVKRDESGDYLMQYDKAFNNEVKLCTLADNGTVAGLPRTAAENTILMYNGYLYYFSVTPVKATGLAGNDYMIPVKCNRIKVEKGAKAEVLGSFDMAMDYGIFSKYSGGEINAGNNGVYFVAGGTGRFMSKSKENNVQYRVCYYDCGAGEFSVVFSKNSESTLDILGEETGNVKPLGDDITCVDDDNNLYIATNGNKLVRVTPSGNISVIYSNSRAKEFSSLLWDGNYIYLYEKYVQMGRIVSINKQGELQKSYDFTVNQEFCKEQGISGLLDADIEILGVDAQNVLIRTTDEYIKGIECSAIISGIQRKDYRTYVVGLIDKKAFEDKSIPIKKIYTYE